MDGSPLADHGTRRRPFKFGSGKRNLLIFNSFRTTIGDESGPSAVGRLVSCNCFVRPFEFRFESTDDVTRRPLVLLDRTQLVYAGDR